MFDFILPRRSGHEVILYYVSPGIRDSRLFRTTYISKLRKPRVVWRTGPVKSWPKNLI